MGLFGDKLKKGLSKLSNVIDTDGVKDTDPKNYPHEFEVSVEGMKCENCASRIVGVLNKLENILAEANVEEKKVIIRTKKEIDDDFIKGAITKVGDFVVTAIKKIK